MTVPFVGDDGSESPAAPAPGWLGATAALLVLASAIGVGAMLYRGRTPRSGDDGVSEPDETTDAPPDDHDDDVLQSDEEYEVLRYDPPLNR